MPEHRPGRIAARLRRPTTAALALCLCLCALTAAGMAAAEPAALAAATRTPTPTVRGAAAASPAPGAQLPQATQMPQGARPAAGSTVAPEPPDAASTPYGSEASPADVAAQPDGSGTQTAEQAAEAALTDTFQLSLFATFKRYRTVGAVLCVFQNGCVTDTFTYGESDRQGTPMTADTMFRVGSISKLVTAMGVMRLAEQGRVALDGDVAAYLGVQARNAAYPDTPITLRQLMTHTAGLRDGGFYTAALAGRVRPLAALFDPDYTRNVFRRKSELGTAMAYSNFGGGLLGCVIEGVTGQTVDAYMNEALFAPLGVTAAYQSALLPEAAPVTDQYRISGSKNVTAVRDGTPAYTQADPATHYTLTAGKLTLSAPDLARVLMALCDGGVSGGVRVLKPETALMMRTAQNGIGSVACDSGRGLCVGILPGVVPGRTLYGHGGKAGGMLCAAYFDPISRTGVVMLTNGCDARAGGQEIGKLSAEVLQLVYGQLIDARAALRGPWLVTE